MESITAWYEKNVVADGSNTLANLRSAVGAAGNNQDNSFGSYSVVYNGYIEFDSANDESDSPSENNLLKVTIRNSNGERLTKLFPAPSE